MASRSGFQFTNVAPARRETRRSQLLSKLAGRIAAGANMHMKFLPRDNSRQNARIAMSLQQCMWCKGMFPTLNGPVHKYMESTPGCWATFGRVLAREYEDQRLFGVHRLTVDSYAVQHPGVPNRQSI